MFDRLDQARSLTGNQIKIIAAAIIGDVVTPKATLDAIVPSFLYFAAWMALCGLAFLCFGFETGRQGIARIDRELDAAGAGSVPAATPVRR